MRTFLARSTLLFAGLLVIGCGKDPPAPTNAPTTSASPIASIAAPPAPREPLKAPERSGGALVRSADGARLYLADEDHKVLRVLPLPFGPEPAAFDPDKPIAAPAAAVMPSAPAPSASAYASANAFPSSAPSASAATPPHPPPPNAKYNEIAMPGAPAQVVALEGFVLATVRDPGLLLVLKEEPGEGLKEQARIPLAADAWGIALSPDEKIAVVTSAWTRTVTAVDWRAGKVLWAKKVAREPRGVVVHPNGKTAYLSHLTSADLTRIDDIDGAAPKVKRIEFPAAPMRTPQGTKVEGSLGYALVLDDSGHRLLAARHAVGGLASWSDWYGLMTIDVLQTQNDQPLLKPRVPNKKIKTAAAFDDVTAWNQKNFPGQDYRNKQFLSPSLNDQILPQPRALVVAHKSNSVWLASEGDDSVGEFPLMAAAPSERPLRTISLGRHYRDPKVIGSGYSDIDGIPSECGAPTGLALSADESMLYVFCRSTYDIAAVRVGPPGKKSNGSFVSRSEGPTFARVATDTDEALARGRKLFYGARDDYSSGGLGCAGCHPDGRDDGHVWHDVITNKETNEGRFLATKHLADKTNEGKLGYPRQTPMLAGRVNSKGPYGWHAQSEGLLERIGEGFVRHRWHGGRTVDTKAWMLGERVNALTVFLRKGLVPPPRITRELTAQEKKGKQIFESPGTACVQCHLVETEYTTRMATPLPKVEPPPGFEDEENIAFKVPSLLYVGGTAPFYHDGSMPTLDALISRNDDRMGKTNQLSAAEKAALVAYMETL